jgi:hypothetical protein
MNARYGLRSKELPKMEALAGFYPSAQRRPASRVDGHQVACLIDKFRLLFVDGFALQPGYDVVDLALFSTRARSYLGEGVYELVCAG